MPTPEQPTLQSRRVRRWLGHLWREWTIESWRPIAPAFAKPEPLKWNDAQVTAAWIGHATVLINLFGINILTDPVLFPRIGIRLPGFTIGPKRLTAPALQFHQLPRIDLILLSHAHFDHFDLRTLDCFDKDTSVITAPKTADLLRWTRLRDITELCWGETKVLNIGSQTKGTIARHPSRLQWLFNRTKWTARLVRWGHRADGHFCRASQVRAHRSRDHVDRSLQPMDPEPLHAGGGDRDGQRRRRAIHHAGASSNVPSQFRAIARTDRTLSSGP